MGSWFTFTKNKAQEVVAIDIGTASVSTALARINPNGLTEIISVLRYPYDLMSGFSQSEGQNKALYLLKGALAKAFADTHRICKSPHEIRISFADPFFEEREIETTINRSDSKQPITEEEINAVLKETKGWNILGSFNEYIEHAPETLASVHRNIIQLKVNGYPVRDATGYFGDTLGIRVRELSISSALKDCIFEQKDKLYPHNAFRFYSDPDILKQAIFAKDKIFTPALVTDIAGEITSLFTLQDANTMRRYAPIFFGLRTLERRVASFLKIDRQHAESMVWQYADGTLDETQKNKIVPIMDAFLEDWYASIRTSLKNAGVRREIAQVIVVGAGKELSVFIEYLNSHIQEFMAQDANTHISAFSSTTDLFLPQQSLSKGGDIILSSLILYG